MHVKLCTLVLLVFCMSLLPSYQVNAAEQDVIIPKEEVSATLWQAQTSRPGQDPERRRLRDVWVVLSMQLSDQAQAAGGSAEASRVFASNTQLLGKYLAVTKINEPPGTARLPSLDKATRTLFDLASADPVLKKYLKKSWLELGDPASMPYTENRSAIARSIRAASLANNLSRRKAEATRTLVKNAKADPAFAEAYDKAHRAENGASIKDVFDVNKFIVEHPDLAIPPKALESLRSDGSMALSVADIQTITRSEFGKINASIDDMQLLLTAIDLQQGDLVDYMKDDAKRRALQAQAEAKAQEHQLKLQAAESAVYIVSTLADFVSPGLGRQISVIGSSAIQIGESLSAWSKAVAGLSSLETLTSLSTVVMTGNVLGAAMNIISLFGNSGPSPEQMILEEIGKLRQQVDQLRTEMHDRFDRIDQQLATIYDTMQDRFNMIDLQLGRISGNVREIQQTLLTMEMALSRIERNNYEFLDAAHRRPLLDAINGGLSYRERTGLDMPYQPDFVAYENTFQSWGTIHAYDALSAGPPQRDYSDGQVLAQLNALPLDANINYLNGWLLAHGLAPITNKRLPSPRDWLFASKAYAQLEMDWPAYARRMLDSNPQRIAALDAVGGELEQAMLNISTLATPNGVQGNQPLFTGVISYYTAKLGAMDGAMQTIEGSFVQERVNELERQSSFELFGGLDQTLTFQSPGISSMNCGDAGEPGVAAPANLKNQTANFNRYNFAEYLKFGALNSCVAATLRNAKPICTPGQDSCDWRGELSIVVLARFNDVTLEQREMTMGTVILVGEQSATEYAIAHWNVYKARFEAGSASVPPSPAQAKQRADLLAKTTTDMQTRLLAYQKALYGRIANDLNAGGLRPLGVELDGSRRLLDSFVTLGLPNAVDNDDLMRSLLYSEQRLVDQPLLSSTYALSATQQLTPANLQTNPRVLLGQLAAKRRNALDELLKRYLDAITAGSYREEISSIANARFQLRLAQRLASDEEPGPGAGRRIFLPLVRR
jgi:hypothetical protein